MTFVAKSLSYLNVLLSSSAMAKNIFCFCVCKGAAVELEPERKIEVTDSGDTAPGPDTAIKEDRDEALKYPITKSQGGVSEGQVSMANIPCIPVWSYIDTVT